MVIEREGDDNNRGSFSQQDYDVDKYYVLVNIIFTTPEPPTRNGTLEEGQGGGG